MSSKTDENDFPRLLLIEFEAKKKDSRKYCCDRMKQEVEFVCPTCEDTLECPDKLIYYSSIFDEYGLLIHDGSGTYELIGFCPWCGSKLPESKRDKWFDELERLGYDEPLNQDIPEKFQDSEWYK